MQALPRHERIEVAIPRDNALAREAKEVADGGVHLRVLRARIEVPPRLRSEGRSNVSGIRGNAGEQASALSGRTCLEGAWGHQRPRIVLAGRGKQRLVSLKIRSSSSGGHHGEEARQGRSKRAQESALASTGSRLLFCLSPVGIIQLIHKSKLPRANPRIPTKATSNRPALPSPPHAAPFPSSCCQPLTRPPCRTAATMSAPQSTPGCRLSSR